MTLSVLDHRDKLGVQPGQLYIDGAWVDASDGATWEQRNPATNEVVTTFAIGSVADVDRAVAAARRAFDEGPWPRLTAKERKKYFTRLVALITEHGEELDQLQTLEMGMPIAFSSMSVVSMRWRRASSTTTPGGSTRCAARPTRRTRPDRPAPTCRS